MTKDLKGAPKSLTRKAVYLRVPPDEQGRILRASLWVGLDALYKKDPENLKKLITVALNGVTPSFSPVLTIGSAWGVAYGFNENPYDSFRHRNIVDPVTWDIGGVEKFKKMVTWTINQTGLASIATYDTTKNTTTETVFQTAPLINKNNENLKLWTARGSIQEGKKQGIIDDKAREQN